VSKATLFLRKTSGKGRRHGSVEMLCRLDHGLILTAVKRRVTDGSVLNLIRLILAVFKEKGA
jgi:hypothetical protein